MESDRKPVFTPDGRALLFISQRNEQPFVSDRDDESLSSVRVSVDPKREWAEMFENAWRLDRDVFFSSDEWFGLAGSSRCLCEAAAQVRL